MTPMIDVVFLLLVFFVLTARFVPDEGDLSSHLPRDRAVDTDDLVLDLQEIIVELRRDDDKGAVAIVNSYGMRRFPQIPERLQVDLGADLLGKQGSLYSLLAKHAHLVGKGVPITIRFDERVRTQAVVTVLDACQGAGMSNVSLGAQEES